MTDAERDGVAAYYARLWSGDGEAAMAQHLAHAYVEHQHTAGFCAQGLLDHVIQRRRAHPDHRLVIHHVLGEGALVFLMAEEKLAPGIDYARAELFRLNADGRIAEHWSSHVLDEKNRKNDRGTFDGARVDRSRDWASRFGARFEALDQRAFTQHDLSAFRVSRVPEYIQHSPKGGDGLEGLEEVLERAKTEGLNFRMDYHHTICDGDFLVSHRTYDCDPPWPLMNHHTFDIFRLNSHGQAVEHWDVMDPSENDTPRDWLI